VPVCGWRPVGVRVSRRVWLRADGGVSAHAGVVGVWFEGGSYVWSGKLADAS